MTTAKESHESRQCSPEVVILNSNRLPEGYGIPYFAGNSEDTQELERRTR